MNSSFTFSITAFQGAAISMCILIFFSGYIFQEVRTSTLPFLFLYKTLHNFFNLLGGFFTLGLSVI